MLAVVTWSCESCGNDKFTEILKYLNNFTEFRMTIILSKKTMQISDQFKLENIASIFLLKFKKSLEVADDLEERHLNLKFKWIIFMAISGNVNLYLLSFFSSMIHGCSINDDM